jgi:DNA-binding CsgD family transcriptional regulator
MFITKRASILKCIWTACLVYLFNIVGDLFIFSFSSLNQDIYNFFFRTSYGSIVGIFVEAFFPALVLIILRRFKTITLIPPFERLDFLSIIVISTLGALTYIVYYVLVEFYNKFKENPQHILANLKLIWVASIGAGAGVILLLRVMNKRYKLKEQELENERSQREIEQQRFEFERQRYETELRLTQEKIDALNHEIGELKKLNKSLEATKTAPQKILDDITDALNNAYGVANRLEDYKKALKAQMETGRVFESNYFSGVIFNEVEIKIIELITEGKTNEEIGKIIHLSAGRVSNIITEILAKTGARDRTVLAVQYVMAKFKHKE